MQLKLKSICRERRARTECRRSARTRTRDCGSMRYRNTRWRTSRKRCSGTEEARTKDSLSRRVNRERVRFEIFDFDFLTFFLGVVRRCSVSERRARGARNVGTGRRVGDAWSGGRDRAIGTGGMRVACGSLDVDFDFGIHCWIREDEFASVARVMARIREDGRRG